MRMLDLFSGNLGVSKVFAERGHKCVCVDLVEPPEMPANCVFVKANVFQIRDINQLSELAKCSFVGGSTDHHPELCDRCGKIYSDADHSPFDFAWASSPCEQFSVFGMKHFFPDPPYPELGIALFNHSRSLLERWRGRYVMENVRPAQEFVGNAVNHCGPFYLWGNSVPPIMPQGITKGFDHAQRRSASERRKSLPALIPIELANCVCDYIERIVEVSA